MQMNRLDDIGENEIRIIGSQPEQPTSKRRNKKWWIAIIVVALLLLCAALWIFVGHKDRQGLVNQTEVGMKVDTPALERPSYVDIADTIINNVSLRRFIPINAKPKLVMGVIKEIPQQYILGAMAADFGLYKGKYQVVGGFIYHGDMISYSKSKYGFCALLKDTVVIGNALSTSYFEQAIEEKGDFFRQHALVADGKVVNSVIARTNALRRSLCRLTDGRICIIDTDMSVSFDSFSEALCQYGVRDAIALMGSGAAVRWAVDEAGRRYIAGADEYDFPEVVNYIVWESPAIGKQKE